MKTKLIVTVLLIMAIGFKSVAQQKKEVNNKDSIINYKTELGLSDVQVEQIKAIQEEFLPKMKEARMAKDKETLKKLNRERKAKIEQLLTPEQLVKWKTIREKIKANTQIKIEFILS